MTRKDLSNATFHEKAQELQIAIANAIINDDSPRVIIETDRLVDKGKNCNSDEHVYYILNNDGSENDFGESIWKVSNNNGLSNETGISHIIEVALGILQTNNVTAIYNASLS